MNNCNNYLCTTILKFMRISFFRLLIFWAFFINCSPCFAGTGANETIKDITKSFQQTIPGSPDIDTIVIRFDYKQSALFHLYTLETLDSIINILLKDTAIRLSIDGYAYKDEGSDSICYYLSLNRALFIQTYVLGRGVDSSKITSLTAYGKTRQQYINKDKEGLFVNCRAEILLVYPPPPVNPLLSDRDEDGVFDSEDKCPDVFGYKDNGGCPEKNTVIVPFEVMESDLHRMTYRVLDSVVAVLKDNPATKVSIHGHAFTAEGAYDFCMKLAIDRADIVKRYLVSRHIYPARIMLVKSYGVSRPINPGKNPLQVIQNARAEIVISENN